MKPVSLDVLAAPGCQTCRAFDDYWRGLAKDWPNVTYRKIDLLSPQGQEMAAKYMIMASPGIVLNGELFQVGGFDRDKFLDKLRELSKE